MSRRKGEEREHKKHSAYSQHIKAKCVGAIVTLAFLSLWAIPHGTEAAFTSTAESSISVESDTMDAPTSLNVANVRVGETDLTWTPTISSYATGYTVLRSENKYGPWTTLATIPGKTASSYIDKTSAGKAWFYRVESIFKNWVSVSTGYEAPPAVGTEFYDSFSGPARSIDGAQTEDGKSTWQLWAGDLRYTGAGWMNDYAATSVDDASVAVVRTPVQDAALFMTDVDGSERFILRGKDPKNYIYAGGTGTSNWYATFEIAEVRDGKRTVLLNKPTIADNQNMRVEIRGNKIIVYVGAKSNDPKSGTVHAEVTTDWLMNDPSATYFGFGFSKSGFGINDFYFNAL